MKVIIFGVPDDDLAAKVAKLARCTSALISSWNLSRSTCIAVAFKPVMFIIPIALLISVNEGSFGGTISSFGVVGVEVGVVVDVFVFVPEDDLFVVVGAVVGELGIIVGEAGVVVLVVDTTASLVVPAALTQFVSIGLYSTHMFEPSKTSVTLKPDTALRSESHVCDSKLL